MLKVLICNTVVCEFKCVFSHCLLAVVPNEPSVMDDKHLKMKNVSQVEKLVKNEIGFT